MFFLMSDFKADKAGKVFYITSISSADQLFLGLFPINKDAAEQLMRLVLQMADFGLHSEYLQSSHYVTWNQQQLVFW